MAEHLDSKSNLVDSGFVEFRGGSALFRLLGRPLRIIIDFSQKTARFENCVRSAGFWNLIPKKLVTIAISDIISSSLFTPVDEECLDIRIPNGYVVVNRSEINDFDGLVSLLGQVRLD